MNGEKHVCERLSKSLVGFGRAEMANKIEVDVPTRLDHGVTWLWMLAESRDASL